MLVQGETFSLGIHSRRSNGCSCVYPIEECALERGEGGCDDVDVLLSAGFRDAVDRPGDDFQIVWLNATGDVGVFGGFVVTDSMEFLGDC